MMLSIGLKPDETQLVKDYILLPLLLDVLEHDRSILCRADLKTPELTNAIIDHLQAAALSDLAQARKKCVNMPLRFTRIEKQSWALRLNSSVEGIITSCPYYGG